MTDFMAALALAVAIEGLLYAAFPEQMKRAIAMMLTTPSGQIRVIGLIAAGIGIMLLFWIRG